MLSYEVRHFNTSFGRVVNNQSQIIFVNNLPLILFLKIYLKLFSLTIYLSFYF